MYVHNFQVQISQLSNLIEAWGFCEDLKGIALHHPDDDKNNKDEEEEEEEDKDEEEDSNNNDGHIFCEKNKQP